MTALLEAVAMCRAVLGAAEDVLSAEGLALPTWRYVSAQGGDWIVGTDCEDCCSQLVVIPITAVDRFSDQFTIAAGGIDGRHAESRNVSFQVLHGQPVNLNVVAGRLNLGTVAVDFDDPTNANTHWAETVPLISARWALAKGLTKAVYQRICEQGLPCRSVSLVAVEPWLEGGCAGSRLTVQVQQ